MKKITLTNGGYAIVDDDRYDELSKFNWYKHTMGYAVTTIKSKTTLMHRYLINAESGKSTDHINRNKLDNRIENLRVCNQSENQANKIMKNKSGHKGIVWDKSRKLWRARINKNGIEYHLGRFKKISEAIKAYRKGAESLYGEFALIS